MRDWPLSVVANLIDTNSWKPKDKKKKKIWEYLQILH